MESLIVSFKPKEKTFFKWRVLGNAEDYVNNPIGFPLLKEALNLKVSYKMLTGVFPDNKNTGLFLGTVIPQKNLHRYNVIKVEEAIRYSCTTDFIDSLSKSTKLSSETTWICANKSVKQAIDTYAEFTPKLSKNYKPAVGWNSWDYYYFTVTLNDVIENMDNILKDEDLAKNIKYIVVDDGWQHINGEWHPNYKFPGGLDRLTKEITDRGFIPGIWIAPILIDPKSYPALRMPELLVKNEYGDPLSHGGFFLLDPTSPAGNEFLKKTFKNLFKAGFRFFKPDYISYLLYAERFYDDSAGPYDAIRELFKIIRECVTDESHILGCSLPAECGPGLADSGRTGIDIHNQWSHLKWSFECYTFKYWMNNRIWVNDPDFLIVRGSDTSIEKETNVVNPNANNPTSSRWRSGDVFNYIEAQTWANIVLLTGGNVFLSDRLDMLNEKGKELITKGLNGIKKFAEPLDLCCGYHPSLWLQSSNDQYRLTIINWLDNTKEGSFDFEDFNLFIPSVVTDMYTGENYEITDGVFKYNLKKHASKVIVWNK